MPPPIPFDITKRTPFRIVLYGENDTGKTTVATSGALDIENFGHTLIIAFDDNWLPVAHRPNISAVQPTGLDDLSLIVAALSVPIEKRTIPEYQKDIRTVVIDGVRILRDDILLKYSQKGVNEGKRGTVGELNQADWFRASMVIRNAISQFGQLNMHVVVTLFEREFVNEDTGEKTVVPDANEHLWKNLKREFNYVWHTKKFGNAHALLTLPQKGYTIKSGNQRFRDAIFALTTEGKTNKESAAGWINIPNADYPTLPTLYKMFKEATKIEDLENA